MHAREAAHWRRVLAGLPEALSLPTDRPRLPVAGHQGSRVSFRCGPERYRALVELAAAHRCTSFMVLHAALAVLLGRLGAGDDIPIGAAVSGRTEEPLGDLVGFFVNTVVLRTDLSGAPSFREILERVRDTDLEAYAHQDLPFDLLVQAVNPRRTLTHHPLFQVMLAFETRRTDLPDFGRIGAVPVAVDGPATAKVDLTFQLVEHQDEQGIPLSLDGYLEYATDLFDADTAEAICTRLLRVLDTVLADPSCPASEIDLITTAERRLELVESNDTAREVPVSTLPAVLAEQAARTPHAPAVVDGQVTLTYAQLHLRADRLAGRLAAVGAVPGRVAALALPRSPELVVALLAVLKAGCAYLPLDPELPAGRMADMLRDAWPVCILTDRATRDIVPIADAAVLLIDDPADEEPAGEDAPAVGASLTPDHPAYVLFTSGSTGRPKGVVVSHAALDNRLRWMQGAFPLAADDRVLHKTPCGFDVSLWELLWPLREGAVLVLAAPDEQRDPLLLARTIRERHVTVVHFVPSLLELFLAEPDAVACTGLRRVVCSGEALSRETVRRFHQVLPGVALENLYGPTEAAIDVTHHSCAAGEEGLVPIGRPVWNTQAYVLDQALRPCPPGVVGELYLGGLQLAKGYLGQPGLTATRFVADPYGPPGARLYRTGDVVRRRTDGAIDYLGREDQQVKLRGQRLELGEIENILAQDATVGSACAVLRTDSTGERRLFAYVTPARGPRTPGRPEPAGMVPGCPDPDGLRDLLADRLPAYMLPAAVIVLGQLPLSPNGKLNRAALPAPPVPAAGSGPEPRTPHEEAVVHIFADLLGLPSVGVEDDFFVLGGHSLLAVRLVGRLRQALGVDVSVHDVFRRPTAAALARTALERAGAAQVAEDSAPGAVRHDGAPRRSGTVPLLPLRPGTGGPPLFFVHPGTGWSWCYLRLLEHLDASLPAYGLQARGLNGEPDEDELPCSVEEMAEDYIACIKEVQPTGPYALLGWSFGGQVAHAMATRLHEAGERVDLLVVFDSYPWPRSAVLEEPDEGELLRTALENLTGGPADLAVWPVSEMPGAAVVGDAVVYEVRRRFAPLADADAHQVQSAIRVGMNNVRLLHRFVPGGFAGDLTLLAARRGPLGHGLPDDMPAGELPAQAPTEPPLAGGWRDHVSGRITVVPIDSGHFDMFTTAAAEVGRLLSPILAAAVLRHNESSEEQRS